MGFRSIGRCKFSVITLVLLFQASFNGVNAAEPDTTLNGRGWVMLDYKSDGWGDNNPNDRNNEVYDARINADNSVTILGTTEVRTEQCSSSTFCWNVDRKLAVLAHVSESGTLESVINTNAASTVFGRFTPEGNKVLVANNSTPWTSGSIKRYHLDGSIDTSFANQGIFTDPDDFLESFYLGMWLDNQGRILVSSYPKGLVRLTVDGELDTSFGINSDGATGSAGNNISSVVQASDGSYYILLSGNISSGAKLRRYTENGILDTDFGEAGEAILPSNTWAAEMLPMSGGGVLLLTGS